MTGADGRPLVSIGLPLYNGGGFLEASIRSLLAQTCTDFELLLSDNASTDGSELVCRRLAEEDPRITYERLPANIGGVGNHNRVRERARGRYFMWASSDDQWRPTYVARCLEVLERNPDVVVAYAINAMIDEHGAPNGVVPPRRGLDVTDLAVRWRELTDIYRPIEPFYGLIRADALAKVRPMVRHPGFDRILFAELGLLGRFVQVEEPLYVRRIHSGQSVGTHPSLKSRYRWISPERQPRFVWPHFEYAAHFASVAMRSAPSVGARGRCLLHLAKWCNWHRQELWDDLASAA